MQAAHVLQRLHDEAPPLSPAIAASRHDRALLRKLTTDSSSSWAILQSARLSIGWVLSRYHGHITLILPRYLKAKCIQWDSLVRPCKVRASLRPRYVRCSITAQPQLPPSTKLAWGFVANLCGTMNRLLFLHFMSNLMHLIGGLFELFDL